MTYMTDRNDRTDITDRTGMAERIWQMGNYRTEKNNVIFVLEMHL